MAGRVHGYCASGRAPEGGGVTDLRHPRDATGLLVEARSVCESVAIRTTAATLFSEHLLNLRDARKLHKQLTNAISDAAEFKRPRRKA